MKFCELVCFYVIIDSKKFHSHINFKLINLEFSLRTVHVTDKYDRFAFPSFYVLNPNQTIDLEFEILYRIYFICF